MQDLTRCWSLGSSASPWPELIIAYDVSRLDDEWPELIIACDVGGCGLLHTDRRTDITTGLHIASFAFTGADAKNEAQLQDVKIQGMKMHDLKKQDMKWQDTKLFSFILHQYNNAHKSKISIQ